MQMTKRLLSLILALTMVVSMLAGITITAGAADELTLTFDLKTNTLTPAFPTSNAKSTTSHVYSLDGVDYTFTLYDGKYYKEGYLMLCKSTGALGLPAISGYKLTKVVATSRKGAAAKVTVAVCNTNSKTDTVSGGAAVNWAQTLPYTYTYNLSGTAVNTMYYLCVANANNAQVVSLELTYAPDGGSSTCEHTNVVNVEAVAATCTTAGSEAGTKCTVCGAIVTGCATIPALGHAWNEGTVTTAATCTVDGVKTFTCTREGCTETKTEPIPATGHTYVNGTCTVCSAAEPEKTAYTLVTDASTLKAGDVIVLASAGQNKAASAMGTGKFFTAVDVTVADGTLSAYADAGVIEITLGGEAGAWTLTTSEGQVGATAAKALAIGKGTLTWTIAIDATTGAATIASTNTSYGKLLYNVGATRFLNYTSATSSSMLLPEIYIKSSGETPVTCEHANTEARPEVPATCTVDGYTAGTFCTDCQTYISGHETIPAIGHAYTYVTKNDGTHTGTCSRCQATVSEKCTGVLTEVGGNEFECSLCGYMWTLNRYTSTTGVANGDHIIIYNAAKKVALGTTASGKKLTGVTIPDSYVGTADILVAEGVAVLTVADYADGQFHLVCNDLYLTSEPTGNGLSFAAAAAGGEMDYALWTIDTTSGLVINNVNAAFNSKIQALEYYNGFTTYSTGTDAAYQMTIYSDRVACTHANTEIRNAVAATCIVKGYTGDTVCKDCASTIALGAEIPVLGHSFTNGTCTNCSATQLTATKVTALTEGATVYIYNAASTYVLSGTPARAAGYFAGIPGTVAGDVLTTSSDALLLTVHVVDGGYKFENNGLYLTYGDDRTTLSMAADSDHAVWALDASYHLISVNDTYKFNGADADLYLQTYTKAGGFTCYATSSLSDNFVLSFFNPSVTVCEHVWDEGVVTTAPTCVADGVKTYTCTLCRQTRTEVIAKTGVHNYGEDHVCTVCGAVDSSAFDFSGNYYIAAIRSSGNYFWMTNQVESDKKLRYVAVDSALTELPTEIATGVDAAKVWTLAKQENGTYLLSANGKFSTWNRDNTAEFDATGKALTVTKNGNVYNFTFVVSATETRYLSLNGTAGSNYFAYYKGTQRNDLSLVPVTGEIPHTHSYAWDGNVGTDGHHTLICSGMVGTCDAPSVTENCTYVNGVCSVCGAAEPVVETHTAAWLDGQAATCEGAGFVGYWYCKERHNRHSLRQVLQRRSYDHRDRRHQPPRPWA